MKTINVTSARSELYKLIKEAGISNEPIKITGKKSNAILISEENWDSIEETLYLLSIPGMRESIIEGVNSSIDECETEPGW